MRQAITGGMHYCGKILTRLWSFVKDASPDRKKLLMKSMQKLFIAIGDLHRYKAHHSSSTANESVLAADRSQAATFYEKAKLVEPYKGKPHNQLGVISLQNGKLISSAYHYCRAISAVEPFPAQQNLLQLFEKCKVALNANNSQHSNSGSGWKLQKKKPSPGGVVSWETVELRLVVLTGINYTQINESDFGKVRLISRIL